jgi:hypothetical protein
LRDANATQEGEEGKMKSPESSAGRRNHQPQPCQCSPKSIDLNTQFTLFSYFIYYLQETSTILSIFPSLLSNTMSPTYRIASIPGDGIGPEVVSATIQVVEKLAKKLGKFDIDFTHIPWGTQYYKETGQYVSDDCLEMLRKFDAGLFGAVGAPGKRQNNSMA